ncbi:hypothetical protein A9Q84_12765 [Halobacteriovorax marinus]|uniref:Uncharacterized protein n=1 Tax=Halobacteriovorax marinus TaxID=97084 RepID=A0A1Y5FF19_9BACT|nr:hypothetical protein A9Q84_12765 [Halobacteriovorax marinus]
MRTYQILLALTIFVFNFFSSVIASELQINKILNLEIEAPIGPATYNYLKVGFEKANTLQSDLILIELNTPGGLVSTTKKILTLIGESKIPVAIWIRPEGASATSAGAIIASAAHILFMSEGTNIGAATPIQMSGELEKGDLRNKAINDLKALIQSLAMSRNRNAPLFGEMIEKARSFESQNALKENLIDAIVNTEEELQQNLNNREIKILGKKVTLKVKKIEFDKYEMDLGQKLLNILANPNTAYILFLIGAALFYLEFQTPGGFIAGSMGAFCLVLAAIGFQVLPLNFGALALIGLSFILFILEIYITSYGLITLAALGSFVSGSLFLYRTEDGYISISQNVIISATSSLVLFLFFIFFFILRDHKNIGKKYFNSQIGHHAKIVNFLEHDGEFYIYQVKIGGEIWSFQSSHELKIGDEVEIKNQDGLILKA